MTLKSRLWNWDVGFDAAKKAWGGWGNPWREYLVNLRAAKEAEASTLSRNELESEFVELSIIMAQLLSDANREHNSWARLGREYDDFAERMFGRTKGVSTGGRAKAANDKDGKQEAKRRVYLRWADYHTKKKVTYTGSTGVEVTYKGKTDFAKQNFKLEPELESWPVIADWCRDWCKGNNIPSKM